MKSAFTIFLLFLISFPSLRAQISHPHFISLNAGTNIPIADYKEIENINLGGAETGFSYSFEGGAYFSKYLGAALHLGVFENGIDEDDIKALDQQINQGGNTEELLVSSDNWVNGFFMIGPILSFGGEKIIIDFKLLGGLMNTTKPTIGIQDQNNLDKISDEVSNTAFGFNYGLHLRIKLIGKLGIRINAEGFQSTQEFETTLNEIQNNGNSSSTEEKIEKEISALNLGGGLIFTF